MPQKRIKAGTSRDVAGARTDEEILKERRRLETFDAADGFLRMLGWGLWALAVAVFFNYSEAPRTTDLSFGAGDNLTALITCGVLCGQLCQASPRGTWSEWRRSWHLAWCPVSGLMALAFAKTVFAQYAVSLHRSYEKSSLALTAACDLGTAGAIATCPSGRPNSVRSASAPLAKMLLLGDVVFGMLLAGCSIAGGSWGEPYGLVASAVSALPLIMFSLGIFGCRTEAELLCAVPSAALLLAASTVQVFASYGVLLAIPLLVYLLLHGALYLPLPLAEPDTNLFYQAFSRMWRRWARFMSQPVSGFGDSSED